jgi:hypothetical protein
MRATLTEHKVVVSAVEPAQREELERLAAEGDRTLSQEIRRALARHLARDHDEEGR